jgi:recombination protein RecR
MTRYPTPLEILINELKKLPGVGRKTAERYAFHLLNLPSSDLQYFGEQISHFKSRIQTCSTCGALHDNTCTFCTDPNRNQSILCIVSSPKEIYFMEETGYFKGLYHVLGTLISPLEGKMPDQIDLDAIKARTQNTTELVIALDSTLEGDATSLYLKEELARPDLIITRLALGIPLGSSLDYVDGGTLARALLNRSPL